MKRIVTPKWMARPKMGVLNGRFCIIMLGNGVTPSLASSWIRRAKRAIRHVHVFPGIDVHYLRTVKAIPRRWPNAEIATSAGRAFVAAE